MEEITAPQEFISCVDALLKEGKDKNSAYAICTMQYKRMHKGHTPQQDEKKSKAEEATPEEIALMGQFYEEVDSARKKKKMTIQDMREYMKGKDKQMEQMMKGIVK